MKFFWCLLVTCICISCTKVNITKEQEKLLEADIAFSDYSETNGMRDAFLKYCAEDGVLLRPNNLPIIGKQNVEDHLSEIDDSNFVLTWKPQYSFVANSGELGYTFGVYGFKSTEESGGQVSEGTYVSIWKKNSRGEWKYVLDSGNQGLE